MSQAFLAETVETGDKNRDDFHCIQMSPVMSMRLIFGCDWNEAYKLITFFAVWQWCNFPRFRSPCFSCNYARELKSKCYSEEILFCGVLRRDVSQNIVAITGTLRLNRFTLLHVFNYQFFAVVKMWSHVALYKTWDINDLTFDYYWKQLQLPVVKYLECKIPQRVLLTGAISNEKIFEGLTPM